MLKKNRIERLERRKAMQKDDFLLRRAVVADGEQPDDADFLPASDGRPEIRITRRICSKLPPGVSMGDDDDGTLGGRAGRWTGTGWKPKK